MRLLIVLPPLPPASGNQVTAHRYRHGLEQRGHIVRLVAATPGQTAEIADEVATFRPDLVHLLHAYRTGAPWLAVESPLPFAVTLTGTDIHQDLHTPGAGAIVRRVLEKAGAIVTQNHLTAADLAVRFPELECRLEYVPPGILLGSTPYPLRQRHGIAADRTLFLHPAGIRPVKGNLELLELLDPLAAAGHRFTAAFCGPVLDAAYGRRFFLDLESRPWAAYLGVIPPEAMAAALQETDVILNNSTSEGLPNALVEAAALGRTILARDIPGNAAVVEHGRNGLLYSDADDFHRQAERLLDSDFRNRLTLAENGRFHPEQESAALEEIYRSILG